MEEEEEISRNRELIEQLQNAVVSKILLFELSEAFDASLHR